MLYVRMETTMMFAGILLDETIVISNAIAVNAANGRALFASATGFQQAL